VTVAVLGPGAVGGTLAVRLAHGGREVVCVARESTAEAIRVDGLTLAAPDGTFAERPEAVERLERRVELLLVSVKAPALEDALGRVEADADLVVPLMNGIEHMQTLRERFGDRVAAGSIGSFRALREGPTRIVQTSDGAEVSVPAHAADLLRVPGVHVVADDDEARVLWWKLARLGPIAALTALRGAPLGELRAEPDLRAAIAEACDVASADGAPMTFAEQWEIVGRLPDDMTTSAARDVAAGRPSELDALVGAIVRAGRRLDVPTPTLERLEVACRAL
jgi:2-dehydropantoate 2-reductase